jgi:hypothetical protein
VEPTTKEGKAALEAAWGRGDDVKLVAFVRDADASAGAWRKFSFGPKPPLPQSPADGEPLEQRCRGKIDQLPPGDSKLPYLVCVDLSSDVEGVVTLECSGRSSSQCNSVGDVIRIGRSFQVYVWERPDTRTKLTFSGTPGYSSVLNEPDLRRAFAPKAQPKGPKQYSFGPRKHGTAVLSVSALSVPKADEAAKELAKIEVTYTIEAVYKGALRLGIGVSWAPWARVVGVQTTPGGQRYSDIVSGQGGVVGTGLAAGYTLFFCDVRESSLDVCPAIGARLGLVGVSTNDVKVFDSLMLGIELIAGPDISLGLFGGIMRHDTPIAGQEPGKALMVSATSIQTSFNLTPAFAVVVNFTPAFMKMVGLAK